MCFHFLCFHSMCFHFLCFHSVFSSCFIIPDTGGVQQAMCVPLLNFQRCKSWIIPNIIADILLWRLSLFAKMQINWVRLVNIYSNCRGLCLVLEHLWRRHCEKHSKIVRLRGKSKKFYCVWVWVNFVEKETELPYVLERRCSELIMGCPHATRNDGSRKEAGI